MESHFPCVKELQMSLSSPLDVIVAGHMCLDMLPNFIHSTPKKIPDLLKPGTLVKIGAMTVASGGAVSNVGIALEKFGQNVGFVAKVGGDSLGTTLIDIVKKHGNCDGIAISKGENSSYTVIISPPGVDRIFLHNPGTNDTFTSEDIDFSIVDGAKLFHFGYPTLMKKMFDDGGDELALLFKKAKERGVITSLDISLPDPDSDSGRANWRSIYKKVLPFVDVFVPSIEEALFTLHPEEYLKSKSEHNGEELIDFISPSEYSALSEEFLSLGCRIITLKSGHNGWYIRTGSKNSFVNNGSIALQKLDSWAEKELWCPAFKVDRIASATGSGDCSIAAFLTSMIKGYTLEKALKFANCAGSMNLSAMDATSGLVSWAEMESSLSTLKTRDIIPLHNTNWTFENSWGGWRKADV